MGRESDATNETKYPGMYSRTSTSRRREGRADVVYDITYKVGSRKVWEAAGAGDPAFRIRHPFPSQATAKAVARARLDTFTRGEAPLSAPLSGRADLVAESRAVLSGFRSGVKGEWSVTRVTHSLTPKGFTTALDAEVPQN